MKLRKYIIGAASTSLIALLGTAAQATTVENTSFRDLVHDAEACVVGTVDNVSYETIEGRAYTIATFNVTDVAFGNVSNTVSIRMNGGRLQNSKISVSETVAGMPRFFNDASYFLLLDDNGGNEFALAGTFQGAIPVLNGSLRLPNSSTLSVEDALGNVNDLRNTQTNTVDGR